MGGILFLRFFCAACVAPEGFQFLEIRGRSGVVNLGTVNTNTLSRYLESDIALDMNAPKVRKAASGTIVHISRGGSMDLANQSSMYSITLSDQSRRILVLIAKVLQNICNNVIGK